MRGETGVGHRTGQEEERYKMEKGLILAYYVGLKIKFYLSPKYISVEYAILI